MKKVLFIASHRKDRAPGQRFRFEQYFDFLEQHGFQCELQYIVSAEDDKILYRQGNYLRKMFFALRANWKRFQNIRQANQSDIIFLFREALMTRSTFFERQFARSKAKMVFDFDDAIWLSNVSDANKRFSWLKNAGKTEDLIALSDMIFAGNEYLANYASGFNKHVKIVPTTIDTEEYQRVPLEKESTITIGWSGSITTIQHFEYALPYLKKLRDTYGDRIRFKVIGDGSYRNEELDITGIGWSKKDELKELSSFDIGIMPLPDDEWAKGKCGLKGLQYMALEIPTLMSPVGVNTRIIKDGENGFLVDTEEEWISKLSQLIESETLRKQLGKAARETVVKEYSVEANKELYLKYFTELLA